MSIRENILLINTQQYIDILMHWYLICAVDMHNKTLRIAIHQCIIISSYLYQADSTVGMGWFRITNYCHATWSTTYLWAPILTTHIYSINFLTIATPLSCACQQHLLGLYVLLQLQSQLQLLYSTSCTITTLS